jgi:uncharacterized protein
MKAMIIDSHIHCGIQHAKLSFEVVKEHLDGTGILGACIFSPVEDIYDRYDYDFVDNAAWGVCRQRANDYVLDIQQHHENFFSYYFVWNEFKKNELKKGYKGIKWHRHEYEPEYHYDDPLCEVFLQEAYRLQLPIILEETFKNTKDFITRVDGRTPVIIPHMGGLNGGFPALFKSGIWDNETIYADTALATGQEIAMFVDRYGSDRLLFGSDFPFGVPGSELREIIELNLPKRDFENVVCNNILKLLKM